MDFRTHARDTAPPSSAQVADWIREQVRANRLVPGQRLVEVDIIRKTGGSRFRVREAFQRLANEGLVEIEEFRGAKVRDASMDEIHQTYRTRAVLEGLCAADFAKTASDEDHKFLQKLADEMKACLDVSSPELFSKLNAQFHDQIMKGSRNIVANTLLKKLHAPVHHLQFQSFYSGEKLKTAVADHQDIVNAILSRDSDLAERTMRLHVENGLRFLVELDRIAHFEN